MKRLTTTLSLITLIFISCSKEDEPDIPVVLSMENTISSFMLTINGEILSGEIDEAAKTISFDVAGADLNSLKPTIQYSDKARLSPSESEAQNFNNEVSYTVYAENGDSNTYRVIVNNRPLSSENKILSFSIIVNNETIEANIDHDKKIINFDVGSFDRSTLTPAITISEHATISPHGETVQNFDNIIAYTVTAENGVKTEYKVIANKPTINGVSTTGGLFTNNPMLLYTGANLRLYGNFLKFDRPNATLSLFDGTNKYLLPMIRNDIFTVNNYVTSYNLYTKIPDDIPNNTNYKIIYEVDGIITETETYIDVISENAPKPISLSQDSYNRNDVLVITGENLTDMIAIPSNGSVFLIANSNNYDYTLNNDKTQISLILDYYALFPSYYARDPEEKIITLIGPGRRAGESITTTFN